MSIWPGRPEGHTAIKVCGLTTPQDIDLCCELGVDFVGLVHYPDSPRHVSLSKAQLLARRAHEHSGATQVVVLLVDPAPQLLTQAIAVIAPDVVQLHGSENAAQIASVKAQHTCQIAKVVSVRSPDDVAGSAAFATAADWLLFDAKPPTTADANAAVATPDTPSGKPLPGGNGAAFDWSLMAAVPPGTRYLLAGGLNPENVAAALAATGAPGVDVSSGVEAARGVKDADKITRFVQAVRAANTAAGTTPQQA
ncbi:MAG: phosphoribosylanthranilate isomerase [Pseudomonadota bacterium]